MRRKRETREEEIGKEQGEGEKGNDKSSQAKYEKSTEEEKKISVINCVHEFDQL